MAIGQRRFTHQALCAGLTLVALLVGSASASAAQKIISSSGPLTNIYLNDTLQCQVNHTGDTHGEFFSGTNPGSCGTLLSVGSTNYGFLGTAFTVVSQSAVTGTGTSADPFQVVSVVSAGSTGLTLTQTDSYVVGREYYRTDMQITNTTSSPVSALIYKGGDCYLGNSDSGFGFYDAPSQGIYCTKTANNSPPDRIIGFAPLNPGSSYYEGSYGQNYANMDSHMPLPNTCDCNVSEDNGASIAWSVSVPAGGSVTRSLLSSFSPTGVVASAPPTVTLTAPPDGSTSNNTRPTFSGAASNNSGDSPNITVGVYSGSSASGTPVQTLTATRSGTSYSVTASTALADGTYTAQSSQSNSDSGLTGTSNTRTFTVNTRGPSVTLTSPANGSTSTNTTPSFGGAAGNASGDSPTVTVRVYAGGAVSGTPLETLSAARSGASYSVASSRALAPGAYTAQAEQTNSLGNTGRSAPSTFQIAAIPIPVRSTQGPKIAVLGVRYSSPGGCVARNFHVSVILADPVGYGRSEIYLDGTRLALRVHHHRLGADIRAASFAHGAHRIVIKAVNSAGNRSQRTIRFTSCGVVRRTVRFTG